MTSNSSDASGASSSSTPAGVPSAPDKIAILMKNDPARTNYDPAANKWLTWCKAVTGQMTREGEFHYREQLYRELEERDCRRCEKDRDWLLANSPIIRFMQGKIGDLNGQLDSSNIHCARCPARLTTDGQVVRSGGGFSPDSGIKICANEMRDTKHLEDTIAHEMVHAWDHLRWQMDGVFNLKHAACTEIRAAMLSGECRWTREWMVRKNFRLTRQFQNCVREKAIMSVMNRPSCRDDVHATKVVNEVWESCFSDTRPFDDVAK